MSKDKTPTVSPLDLIEADEEAQVASERALLANALDDPVRAVPIAESYGITGADFGDANRGAVFDAILSMFASGEAVDAVTVNERLVAEEKPDAIPEISKALETGDRLPFHFDAHCRNVLRRSMRRRLGKVADRLSTATEKPSAAPEKLAAQAVDDLSSLLLAVKGERSTAEEVAVIANEWIDLGDGTRERRGVPPPTAGLRELFGGRLEPGLHVLAGKTSTGKSTVEGSTVRHVALLGGRVLRSFHDMDRHDLLQRDLAALCFLRLSPLQKGKIHPDERAILPLAVEAWKTGLAVETLTVPTLPQIVARMRALHASAGLDLVTVDFVQQVRTGNSKIDANGNTNTQIGEVTKALKNAALDLGVPVLLLSQLNRNDRNEYNVPELSDLRDSGNIEQDARTVSFLSPDSTAQGWVADKEGAESWRDLPVRPINYSVKKNQQGKTGTVPLRLVQPVFSIEDTGRNPDHSPRWAYGAGGRNGDPVPVIARDANGVVGGFDPRFLALVNKAAEKMGKPTFEIVEQVEDGAAKVVERVKEWRARK